MRFRENDASAMYPDLVQHPEGGDRWRWAELDQAYEDACGAPTGFNVATNGGRTPMRLVDVGARPPSIPSVVERVSVLDLRDGDTVLLEAAEGVEQGQVAHTATMLREALRALHGIDVNVLASSGGVRVAAVLRGPAVEEVAKAEPEVREPSPSERYAAESIVAGVQGMVSRARAYNEAMGEDHGLGDVTLTPAQWDLLVRCYGTSTSVPVVTTPGLPRSILGVPVRLTSDEANSTPVVNHWRGWGDWGPLTCGRCGAILGSRGHRPFCDEPPRAR